MRSCSLAVVCLIAAPSAAAEVEKLYYVGEAKLSSATGQPMGSQAFLLEKIHDQDNSQIIERAVVVKPDGTANEYPMTMKVKGDSFTITDAENTISGSGKLFGPAWHWTYFKATYSSTNGARIEDENYMADPGVLVARKTVSLPDGKVVMHMDITLKTITPQTFAILAAGLLKKESASKVKQP
ncbi:MAG TPA: hypothetical protein VFB80_12095 [Pirellulaceae bacterium]|nr:hypothetical protein [Pirellulaceae bacterium]